MFASLITLALGFGCWAMICNNMSSPKIKRGENGREVAQISAYTSALALSHARMARLTGKPQ